MGRMGETVAIMEFTPENGNRGPMDGGRGMDDRRDREEDDRRERGGRYRDDDRGYGRREYDDDRRSGSYSGRSQEGARGEESVQVDRSPDTVEIGNKAPKEEEDEEAAGSMNNAVEKTEGVISGVTEEGAEKVEDQKMADHEKLAETEKTEEVAEGAEEKMAVGEDEKQLGEKMAAEPAEKMEADAGAEQEAAATEQAEVAAEAPGNTAGEGTVQPAADAGGPEEAATPSAAEALMLIAGAVVPNTDGSVPPQEGPSGQKELMVDSADVKLGQVHDPAAGPTSNGALTSGQTIGQKADVAD